MRILLITPRPPHPMIGGDRVRTGQILRHLARTHDVTLVTLAATPSDERAARALESVTARTVVVRHARRAAGARVARAALPGGGSLQQAYFCPPALRRAVRREVRRGQDVALASLVRTAPALLGGGVPAVVDVQDSISLHYRRAVAVLGGHRRALYRLELPRIEAAERDAARRADACTLISPVDLADLRRRAPDARLCLVPNGVEQTRFRPLPGAEPVPDRMLFLGNLRTVANADMARRAARRILPLVRARRPRAHLHIVGVESPRRVRALHDGVSLRHMGPVTDPERHLCRAVLTLCPMRFGAGLQNKVLESLAVGTPVVLSPMAAAPLGLEHGQGVWIAEDDAAMAEACVALLEDRELRAAMGERGLRLVRRRFTWPRALAPLERLLEGLAGGGLS